MTMIFGLLSLVGGVVLFFVRNHYQRKLRSIKRARPTTIAQLQHLAEQIAQEMGAGSWRDYVKLSGRTACETPIHSELKQAPCVHYEMRVVREYEETVRERDSDGKPVERTKRGSETLSSNRQSIPFELKDKTDTIAVDPTGAQIDTTQILDEFQREAPTGGRLSWGGFSLDVNDRSWGGRRTLGYRYTESILPVDRPVFIVAQVSDANQTLVLEKPLEPGQRFIISLKSEAQLAQATANIVVYTLYGMIAAIVLGIVLLLVEVLA